MKTILVDAIYCFVLEDGTIFQEMFDLLETYPNKKILLTGADDNQWQKFNLGVMPYPVFTLKHSPEKTDPAYYKMLLTKYNLLAEDCVYFEHSKNAAESARSIGIATLDYDSDIQDLESLKKFLELNLL